jgi:hypothetical protein
MKDADNIIEQMMIDFFIKLKLIEITHFALAGWRKTTLKNPDFGADLDLSSNKLPHPLQKSKRSS